MPASLRSKIIHIAPERAIHIVGMRIRLTRRAFSLELAADFAALQCDSSYCVLLHKGLSLAEGRYVQFDFLLADPYAANAVFDLGVVHDHGWQRELPAEDLSKYQSLCTITLPLGRSADQAIKLSAQHRKAVAGLQVPTSSSFALALIRHCPFARLLSPSRQALRRRLSSSVFP
jgi:hypothetical protein